MLSHIKRYAPIGISLFAAVVFLDSLRFKFTDHPNTQEIFGRLDGWAGTLGAAGLFGHTGLFSQYVIGSAELLASTLLLVGLLPRFTRLNALGALIGFAVMSGAVSFHLFTPLGIDPNNDGGGLFAAAVTIWFSAIALLIIRRAELMGLVRDLARAFVPTSNPAAAPLRAPAHA
ncbi:hypothetical protein [Vitreimonas sp.]|uniref:hypothetical protein n=1 Tax=Vitreimonas sp. TaxID=3069702 RepID=UPI002ED8D106